MEKLHGLTLVSLVKSPNVPSSELLKKGVLCEMFKASRVLSIFMKNLEFNNSEL